MSERESQRERELDTSVDIDGFESEFSFEERSQQQDTTTTSESKTGRIRGSLSSLVSPRGLLAAALFSVLGIVLIGLVPLVPATISTVLGVFTGTFLFGMISRSSQYVESGLAGLLLGGGLTLWTYFPISVFGASTTLLGFGIVGGLLAGVAGHYFGRDLRDGLTRDIE